MVLGVGGNGGSVDGSRRLQGRLEGGRWWLGVA